jgi:hypothetical protein
MKKLRNIRIKTEKNDTAVAGIVVAVMIVGLLLAVISIIQTVYVPKWMESREAEHMGVIADQFSQLKYAIDAQSMIRQPLPMSTSITLGSKELGFLTSSKAFGHLSIQIDATTLHVQNSSGTNYDKKYGILKYSSENSYFLDQTYVFEMGSIILNQTQGQVLSIKPAMITAYDGVNGGTLYLNLTTVNLVPLGGKTSISGYGSYPIRTEYVSTKYINATNNVNWINITTQFPRIWFQYFNDTLNGLSLKNNTNYIITIINNKVILDFCNPSITNIIFKRYFNLRLATINVQIAPGWIE